MEIKTNNSASSRPVIPPAPVAASARAVDVHTDAAEFSRTNAINQAMSSEPASRPEEVARAKQLVADNNYPPPVVIGRITKLLAIKLAQDNASVSE